VAGPNAGFRSAISNFRNSSGDYDREWDVTQIGPRSFIIGFVAYCGGFLALLYGVDRFIESCQSLAPVATAVRAHVAAPVSAPPGSAPVRAAAPGRRAPRVAHPPLTIPRAALRPAAPRAASPPPARPAAALPRPAATALPVPPPAAKATPAALVPRIARQAPIRPAARTVKTPAPAPRPSIGPPSTGLLVPFKNAAALTPSDGLDPRSAHGSLLINPAGPAPPTGGSGHVQ
jgi:hypothetical protein